MGRLCTVRRAPRRRHRLLLLAALLAVLPAATVAGSAALVAYQAWAQEYDETRHGRLAVERPVYVMEAHLPVTVEISGQVFAESEGRRQVVVVVTLPDSSMSKQYTMVARSGHFTVPYQLDKTFPTGADSRPGRYAVSASYGGASLGTVYFEVVRPPQVPAQLPSSAETGRGPTSGQGAVTGLSASVSRPIYSPDAAVTVHGTAEGAGAGVRLRIDVAGPSAGILYSGVLTTSSAGTYSATIMAPDGRWGGDGEYTAVVTGAGYLARAPFWIESGEGGGAPSAAVQEEEVAPEEAPQPDIPASPAQEEDAGGNAGVEGGWDMWIVPSGLVAAILIAGVFIARRRRKDKRIAEDEMPIARRPAVPRQEQKPPGGPAVPRQEQKPPGGPAVPRQEQKPPGGPAVPRQEQKPPGGPAVPRQEQKPPGGPAVPRQEQKPPGGPAVPRQEQKPPGGPAVPRQEQKPPRKQEEKQKPKPAAAPSGPQIRTNEEMPVARQKTRVDLRVVLDQNIVIKHRDRSKGNAYPKEFDMLLNYVDAHKDDLLIPSIDRMRPNVKSYARANLKPVEDIIGYQDEQIAITSLRDKLLNDPLCAESISWIVMKSKWLKEKASKSNVEIGRILDNIGIFRKERSSKFGNNMEAVVEAYAGNEKGKKEVKVLLDFLELEADSDMKLLSMSMKESREKTVILLTDDYDLFAFPIWGEEIAKAECSQVTMVVGKAHVRWIVMMRDGTARVISNVVNARRLYSKNEYSEVRKALEFNRPIRSQHRIRAHYSDRQDAD